MARSDALYDNPRSKPEGKKVAEKGDRKKVRGREYESVGDEEPDMYFDRPAPEMGDEELPHEGKRDKKGKREYWRPLKREVPVS
jgi:hypothetical protein